MTVEGHKPYELGPLCPYCKERPRKSPGFPCRECIAKRARENRNPQRERGYKLKGIYGISLEEFDTLLESQGFMCAICNREKHTHKNWHVDHGHITNIVRGILCSQCNTALGLIGDDVNNLRSAITYLERVI